MRLTEVEQKQFDKQKLKLLSQEGRKEGRKGGRKEGRKKGRKEEREKGRKEERKARRQGDRKAAGIIKSSR